MTVIVTARTDAGVDGIQPFDARRHLRQVAELVAAVFANELDASGRTALQEMETIGRWSPVLGTLLSSAFFTDFVSGYVWVEDGRVIGNVTLQRQEDSGTRWRISNVAVAGPFRGRGIARQLMLATLREISRRGGSWAVLQVRVDNPPARRLYERLNFTNVCQDGLWHAPFVPAELPPRDPTILLQPLRSGDWRARFELAQAARPALAHWAAPVYADSFRPSLAQSFRQALSQWAGLGRTGRWGWWTGDVLAGEVEVQAHSLGNSHQLCLTARPDVPEGVVITLLEQGLSALRAAPSRPVLAEYNGDLVAPGMWLEAMGFRPRRVLLTMRRVISPGDAEISIPGLD
jgi:ribosomal protein S18 acetylase RimI-like enzyme